MELAFEAKCPSCDAELFPPEYLRPGRASEGHFGVRFNDFIGRNIDRVDVDGLLPDDVNWCTEIMAGGDGWAVLAHRPLTTCSRCWSEVLVDMIRGMVRVEAVITP